METNWTIPTLDLDDRESRFLARAAGYLRADFRSVDSAGQAALGRGFAEQVRLALPNLADFVADGLTGIPVVRIRGLPARESLGAVLATGLSSLRGEVFQYQEQNGGELTVRIEPRPNAPANSNATAEPFGFHTDDAVLAVSYRTQDIALLGIHNPRGTLTGFSRADLLFDAAPGWCTDICTQPRFSMRVPASFGLGEDFWFDHLPILSFDRHGRPEVAWPTYATRPTYPQDREAQLALAELNAMLEHGAVDVPVSPGHWLLFDNSRVLHRRGAIGGGRRLLFRNYIRISCHALRAATGTAGPIFSARALLATQENLKRMTTNAR
jgi:hypothetical protein